MSRLFCGEKRGEGGEREMDTRERNEIGLEFVEIDVQRTIEPKGGGDRRDDLSDQSIEIGEARQRNTQAPLADVIDSLVINLPRKHEHASRYIC